MDGRDFLFTMEEQALYLEEAVALMCRLTTELNDELAGWETVQPTYGLASELLRRCSGFNVLLREMTRISSELNTAVSKGFEELKSAAQAEETGR